MTAAPAAEVPDPPEGRFVLTQVQPKPPDEEVIARAVEVLRGANCCAYCQALALWRTGLLTGISAVTFTRGDV